MTTSENVSYIPLSKACRKYSLAKKDLLEAINAGTIAAVELKTGELLVVDPGDDPCLDIKRDDFVHLHNISIGLRQAAKKYAIPVSTLSGWVKAGYIKTPTRSYRLQMNEADVAYCAAVYKVKYDLYHGRMSGVPIFDENGNPYQAKYPEMAAYKRNIRNKKRQKNRKLNQ